MQGGSSAPLSLPSEAWLKMCRDTSGQLPRPTGSRTLASAWEDIKGGLWPAATNAPR